MTNHLTNTGYVEIEDSWGHGRPACRNWAAEPDVLTFEDGDGHFTAWAYTGEKKDAAMALAMRGPEFDDAVVWALEGNHIYPVRRSDWAAGVEVCVYDEDGELIECHYHPEAHPGGFCMG